MTSEFRTCECGNEFRKSAQDYTRRCPSCRAADRTPPSRDEYYSVKVAEAQMRGRAARRAGDTEAMEQAVADFNHWRSVRDAARNAS